MSFFESISQCGEIGHAKKAFLAWKRSSGEKAGVKPMWAAWCDSVKAREVEKKKKQVRDKGFLIEAVSWWKGVLACLGQQAWNLSAFKCICGKEETLQSSPASSPRFVPKPPIPSPIWMACCFEFWWRKTKNPPLPFPVSIYHHMPVRFSNNSVLKDWLFSGFTRYK